MAGQDTSTADEVLKTVYGDGIVELIPNKAPVLDMFENLNANDWGGRFVEYPARIGRNSGVGYSSEGGLIPAAGRQQFADWRIGMRWGYGRVTFTAQAMKASEGSRNSFVSIAQDEMKGLVRDLTAMRGRMIFGDGRGVMAFVNGSANSATQTVDTPGGWAGSVNGSRFLNVGDVIGFINPATGALRASSVRTVQSIGALGTTIVLDSAFSSTDNDYIVKAANTTVTSADNTSYAKEPMGLAGLIDDGTNVATLSNINRTTVPLAQSTVIAVNGAWSADVMQRGLDLADERGDGNITKLIMHHSVRRAIIAATEDARRYMGSDLMRPDAGTAAAKQSTMTFGGIPFLIDKRAPYGVIFQSDPDGLKRFVLVKGEWADDDGAVLRPVGVGTAAVDSFEAYYRIWDNFQNDRPPASSRLDGISASVTVAHVD